MDYIIETENLTKRYGTATVVDKVNLHVPKGKIYGLLGRNGAGKTTAMKMMLQLAFPTEGTVRLFGTNYKENIHTLYSKVGSIIETPGFYSNLTGYENLQILAKLRGGVSKSGVEKALEVVGLHKEKRKVFSDYSLGMKQRLGIAAAIMHEPELLILDEPINGLDPIGIVEIRSFLSCLLYTSRNYTGLVLAGTNGQSGQTLMILDYDFTIDEETSAYQNIKTISDFTNQFITVEYTIGDTTYSDNVVNLTPNRVKDKLILQATDDIKRADNVNILVTIRNRCYKIKVK